MWNSKSVVQGRISSESKLKIQYHCFFKLKYDYSFIVAKILYFSVEHGLIAFPLGVGMN